MGSRTLFFSNTSTFLHFTRLIFFVNLLYLIRKSALFYKISAAGAPIRPPLSLEEVNEHERKNKAEFHLSVVDFCGRDFYRLLDFSGVVLHLRRFPDLNSDETLGQPVGAGGHLHRYPVRVH